MEENSRGRDQPLSLNQRHSRIIDDIAQSRSKPTAKFLGDGVDENLQGRRRRLRKAFRKDEEDDIPDFSAIVDFEFDSPFSGGNSSKMENHSASPISEEVVDENPLDTKADFQGRRHLCEASPVAGKDDISDVSGSFAFDSPTPPSPPLSGELSSPKEVSVENDVTDDLNIRDILGDFSSKFERLAIENNQLPKNTDEGKESGILDNPVKKKEEFPKYGSAAASFLSSSNTSLGFSKESEAGRTYRNKYDDVYDLDDESETYSSLGEVRKHSKTLEILKESNTKVIRGQAASTKPSFSSTYFGEGNNEKDDVCVVMSRKAASTKPSFSSTCFGEGNNEKDDECVVMSGKDFVKKPDKRHGKSKHVVKGSDKHNFLIDDSADKFASDELQEHAITLTGTRLTFNLPGKIGKMLFPHQREGLKWLWSLHSKGEGGILGDDMGLGKTMQICGFLAGLFHSNLIKRALVVAPKTLLPHWIKELTTVGLSHEIREYFATNVNVRQSELQYALQNKGILLTTYDIVRHNAKSLCGEYYDDSDNEVTWDYLILDEGHLIKNPSTQRAKSLIQIPASHRIIISGTPLQNNLKELWALFNFCCPELLGDYKWFKDKYEKLINRGNEKNASDREKRVGSTVAKDLREKIHPYFLRRMKSDVMGEDNADSVKLSKKNEIIVWLKLTRSQQQIYEAFLNSEIVLSAFDGSPLAALTILKKICDHPLLLTKRAAEDILEGMDSMLHQNDHGVAEKLAMHIADVTEMFDIEEKYDISCKTSFILSILGELIPKKHHVLIFSQTRKMLNIIEESLSSNGYKFMRIDGTTKACDRLQIVNDFQEGRGAPIFLLTSQVGGLGLTLTKADRVIVVDPAWNPSTDNQSVDRAYRIGQTKDVIVYRLMTCGTVEEKIYRMQIFKGGLFRTATEHREQMRYFSKQDLQELFSIPKQGFEVSLTQQQLAKEHGEEQMDGSLKADIEFLESLDIAGVSQHSLLFSKVAPETVAEVGDEVARVKGKMLSTYAPQYSSSEQVHGAQAQYAFNPKDVKLQKKNSSPSPNKLTETEIRESINRLSRMLANKEALSKLPDNGEKIRQRIAGLDLELRSRMEKVVDVEDLSGVFERLNTK